MNKLKKIALISAIVCAACTLGAIVTAPLAVSSGIKAYNSIVKDAIENPNSAEKTVTLPSTVTELHLSNSRFVNVVIRKSKDANTYISTQDAGFTCSVAEIEEDGADARIKLSTKENFLVNEENVKKAINFAINGASNYWVTISVPETVSIHVNDEDLNSLYIDLDYQDFANAQELAKQISGSRNGRHFSSIISNNSNEIELLQDDIDSIRSRIEVSIEDVMQPASFLSTHSQGYLTLKKNRLDLARRCMLQKQWAIDGDEMEYHGIEQVVLPSTIPQLVQNLSKAEQEYDLLRLKDRCAYRDNTSGILDASSYGILHKEYTDQIDALKKEIDGMTQQFSRFCYEWDGIEPFLEIESSVYITEPKDQPVSAGEVQISRSPVVFE